MNARDPSWRGELGSSRFTKGAPLAYSKSIAEAFGCDLAVPNGPGLGNIVIYSRLVADMAWHLRRPLSLLSCPMRLVVGACPGESLYPLWENHPFVREIKDPTGSHPEVEKGLIHDKDDLCQFGHITANLCQAYGIPNRANHGALYLTAEEMKWALDRLSGLARPIVCIHPAGKSSSPEGSPWFIDNWYRLWQNFAGHCSMFRLGFGY